MWVFAPFAVIKAPRFSGGLLGTALTVPDLSSGKGDFRPVSGLTDAQKIKDSVAVGFP